jgi:chitinase
LSSQTLGEGSCNETFQFALSGKAAVGFYIGSGLASQGVITSVLESLINQVQSDGTVTENLYVQLCDNRTARYSLGVFANTNADLHSVQQAVQSWRNNTCITENDSTTPNWQEVTFLAPSLLNNTSSTGNNSSKSTNSTTLAARTNFRKLVSRDSTCTTVEVVSGDTCATLAAECGITTDELTDYNPSSDNCTAFTVGESVCCSSGTISQVSNAVEVEGDCEKHLVGNGDLCSTLAAANNITVSDIESYNTDTWGWMGCGDLLIGNYICLSSGYPPMPTTIANAVCGPQVNGTATVPHGTDLSTLNQCPLNACCDIWGQCGTTAEFCTISNSTTGAPGTAAANQNGCISNCGTDIVTSSSPAQIYSIAYYEAFDWQRPCLKMSVDAINTADYTHIHFAFATINADYSLNVSSIVTQLPILSAMNGVKRILSIGGWDFSTNPSTYMIFRDVVASETSRATLITSVVNLLTEYNLDGVDWDWEYPDEPDIPGIPAGSEQDSIGFFLLIDELKASLAASSATSGMTVSITAPASYWYLQYFPIEALSAVVDYIVYMTYDLHGQWDYGRTWSDPGCTEGNCLRSHVNLTETINALSMITKAGVPANTIAVGVSSYGRSFEMTEAGCWTEMCTYAGPDSGALPGPCTDTAGYIADYELELVIAENPTADLLWDENSFSNILVYNGTQWAAYMNDSNKAVRTLLYESLNFLGVSDWAVDLQSNDGSDSSSSTSTSTSSATAYINPDIWTAPTPLVTAPPGEYLIWPPMPLGGTSVFSFDLWYTTISYSSLTTLTSTDSDGGTSTYPWYIYVPIPTVLSIPPGMMNPALSLYLITEVSNMEPV